MNFRLDADIFSIIKNGVKDVEIRLYDDKRKKLKVGDKIVFYKRPEEIEKIECTITKLEKYNSFSDVVDNIDMERIYLEGTSKEDYIKLMRRFYSEDEEKNLGVLAIYFKVDD